MTVNEKRVLDCWLGKRTKIMSSNCWRYSTYANIPCFPQEGSIQVYSCCGSSLHNLLVKKKKKKYAAYGCHIVVVFMFAPHGNATLICIQPKTLLHFSRWLFPYCLAGSEITSYAGLCPGLQATAAHVHRKLTAPLGIWICSTVSTHNILTMYSD